MIVARFGAIAEWLAHIYCFSGVELAKLPEHPANEQLLRPNLRCRDRYGRRSGRTGEAMVRSVLG